MRLCSCGKHTLLTSLEHMAYSYWAKRRALYSTLLSIIVFILRKIASNCGLATNGVWYLMPSPHPYPYLRHPPTSLEQRLSIIHLGPYTIQMAPSRRIGAIFPNLMSQPQSIIKWDTFTIRVQPFRKHYEQEKLQNMVKKVESSIIWEPRPLANVSPKWCPDVILTL